MPSPAMTYEAARVEAQRIRRASGYTAFACPLLAPAGWVVARSLEEMNAEEGDPETPEPLPLLRDVLPAQAAGCEYEGKRFRPHLDTPVVRRHDGRNEPWPGKERNVWYWWTLTTGYRVGFNENPSHGWSFPLLAPSLRPPLLSPDEDRTRHPARARPL